MEKEIKGKKIKNYIRQQKGISLLSLAVAVIIMLLITSVILFNTQNSTQVSKLKQLQNDIDLIEASVQEYYMQYGTLPVKKLYSNTSFITEQIKNPNDNDSYYIVDLSAIPVKKLQYGKDFTKIDKVSDVNTLKDIYIINEKSHTVYYPNGIKIDGFSYYRDNEQYSKVTTVQEDKDLIQMAANTQEWTKEDVIVNIRYGENLTNKKAGIGQADQENATQIVVTENAIVYASAIDSKGMKVQNKCEVTNIDKLPPEIKQAVATNTNWTNQSVILATTAIDEQSGIQYYQYSTGEAQDDNWVSVQDSKDEQVFKKEVTENGTYYCYVKDKAGNINSKAITVNNIDTTKPIVAIFPNGGNYAIPTGKSVARIETTLSIKEEESGIAISQYAWSNSSTVEPNQWVEYTEETILEKTDCIKGNYYLWVKVVDKAGNRADTKVSEAFKVGEDAPSNKITLLPNITDSTNQNVSVNVVYGDNLVLNRKAGFNVANQENATNILVSENGTVYAEACDIAGNKIIATLEINNIDKTKPTVAITTNEKTPTNAQKITYSIKWSEPLKDNTFTLEDITVTNGTKESLQKQNDTTYTLVVATADKQNSTVKVEIPADCCTDIAENTNVKSNTISNVVDRILPAADLYEDINSNAANYQLGIDVADYESGIDYIVRPDGTKNYISDDGIKILIIEQKQTSYYDLTKILRSEFPVVDVDTEMTTEEIIASDYNVIISDYAVWQTSKSETINALYKAGKNILTIGNDDTAELDIINSCVYTKELITGKRIKENEITAKMPATTSATQDTSQWLVNQFKEGAEVWYNVISNGREYPAVAYLEENETRWIHIQSIVYGELKDAYTSMIRKLARKNTTTYQVPGPGTYEFQVFDKAGNKTVKSFTVPENYNITFQPNPVTNYITPNADQVQMQGFTSTTNYCLGIGTMNLNGLKAGDVVTISMDIDFDNITADTTKNYFVRAQGSGNLTVWQPRNWLESLCKGYYRNRYVSL